MSKKKINILSLRKDIDQLDEAIAKLLLKRIHLTTKIITLKNKKELALIDNSREREVSKNYQLVLKKYSSSARILNLRKAIIALNPDYPSNEITSSHPQKRKMLDGYLFHLNR